MKTFDLGPVTAYAIAVKHGFKGTEEEWLESLGGKNAIAERNMVDLKKYGITVGDIDHKAPYSAEEYAIAYNNAKGIQNALNEMSANGIGNIVLPRGTYVICYQNPTGGQFYANTGWEIVIPSNVDFDLNGSTIRVLFDSDNRNPYDLSTNEPYTLNGKVFLFSQTYNSTIRNGKLLGDRYERSYANANEKACEQTYGVIYTKGSTNCSIEDMEISGFMGDAVAGDGSHDPDKGSNITGLTGVPVFYNIALDDSGNEVTSGVLAHTFTSNYYDLENIVSFGTKTMTVRTNIGYAVEFASDDGTFTVFFYDADKAFLKKAEYEQCDNIPIPANAQYCRLMIVNSASVGKTTLEVTCQITPPSPQIAAVRNCKIYNNNRGGLSNLPHEIVVEGCELFENGTAGTEGWPLFPDTTRYAINCEDTVCRKIIIRNNNIHDGFNCILMSAKSCLVEGNVFRNFIGVLGVYSGKDNILSNNWIEGTTRVANFAYENQKDRHILVTSNYLRGVRVEPNDQIVYDNNVVVFDKVDVQGDNTVPQCLSTCRESLTATNKYVAGYIVGAFKDTKFEMVLPQYSTTRDFINLGENSENVIIEYSGDAVGRAFLPLAVNSAKIIGGHADSSGNNNFKIDNSEIIPRQDPWGEYVYAPARDSSHTFKNSRIVLDENFEGIEFFKVTNNGSLTDHCNIAFSFENCEIDILKSGVERFLGINLESAEAAIHISLVFKNCVFRNRTGAKIPIAYIPNPTTLDDTNYSVIFEGNTLEGEWTLPPNVVIEEDAEQGAGIVLTNTAAVGQIIEVAEVDEAGQPTRWTATNKPEGGEGVTLANAAKVGQTIIVKSVDENGKPTEWEAVNMASGGGEVWRYLGKFETAEDVGRMEISADADGKAFSLKKILVSGLVAANSAGFAGWMKLYTKNDTLCTLPNAVAQNDEGTIIGCGFQVEVWIVDGVYHVKSALRSADTTNRAKILTTPASGTELDTVDKNVSSGPITTIIGNSYANTPWGAGSYMHVWGVDA